MIGAGVMTTGKIVDGMSGGYHLIGDSLITAPYRDFSLMKGSGDMYAAAQDLTLWNHSFLARDTWDKTLKAIILESYTGKSPGYGYGWFIRQGKRLTYYHGGGTFGCSAFSAWYPGEKISIVILSNVSVIPIEEIWADIEKIVFKDPFTMPPADKVVALPPESLLKFSGTYILGDQQLQIMVNKNQLYGKQGSHPAFEIYAKNNLSFFGKKVTIDFTFTEGPKGNIVSVQTEARGQTRTFVKR